MLASQPQYALIAQALMADIASGRQLVGSLLPSELDLCTQFGVSRHTVREAMRMLQDRGLVSRQRGVGTLVKADKVETHYVQSTASIADLLQYVEDTRLVTERMTPVVADAALAEVLKCTAGQRWVHVRGFRYVGTNEHPIALTDIFLHAAFGGVKKLIGVHKVPVYRLIEQQYGQTVVEVRQRIEATLVGEVEARALSVEPGSAGLVVTRHYVGKNDQVLEVAVNLHPAERYAYSQSLRLQNMQL
ncbi:MAG: GntR family transcriptional regulator [Ideonella sp.]